MGRKLPHPIIKLIKFTLKRFKNPIKNYVKLPYNIEKLLTCLMVEESYHSLLYTHCKMLLLHLKINKIVLFYFSLHCCFCFYLYVTSCYLHRSRYRTISVYTCMYILPGIQSLHSSRYWALPNLHSVFLKWIFVQGIYP